jgi:hypothetical protein
MLAGIIGLSLDCALQVIIDFSVDCGAKRR